MFSSIELVTLSCQFIYAQQLEKKKNVRNGLVVNNAILKIDIFFNNMRINMY